MKGGQSRFHSIIELVQQIDQIVNLAASLAAPVDLPSGSLQDQRLLALGADKIRWFMVHGSRDLVFCLWFIVYSVWLKV
jgi:hypothetical protein